MEHNEVEYQRMVDLMKTIECTAKIMDPRGRVLKSFEPNEVDRCRELLHKMAAYKTRKTNLWDVLMRRVELREMYDDSM